MKQFQTAFGLYALWCGLAWLSNGLGATMVSTESAMVLLAGVLATNVLFFLIARSSELHQPPATTVAVAQCIFSITWITLYAFLSAGAGELVPGMYLTSLLYAMFRVPRNTFTQILAISAGAYIAVSLAKVFLAPTSASFVPQILSVVAFVGIATALLVFSQYIHAMRTQLIDRNSDLQSMIKRLSRVAENEHPRKSFNRHFILESLSREKGRADRSNQPFSVCVVEADNFDALIEKEGQLATENISKDMSKRLRGEIRFMDGLSPSTDKRLFGRVSADVFVLILPATNIDGALSCAERIRGAIAERPFLDNCRLTASAGIAEYRRNEPIQSLLARAEGELKIAQRSGGNCVAGMEYREQYDSKVAELPAIRS